MQPGRASGLLLTAVRLENQLDFLRISHGRTVSGNI
jgi:hypothetical protein